MPTKIYYFEKPFPQVKDFDEKNLIPEDNLSKFFSLDWIRCPDLRETQFAHAQSKLEELAQEIEESSMRFAVCKIDDRVGRGVWTIDPIERGKPVAIYAGSPKVIKDEDHFSCYSMGGTLLQQGDDIHVVDASESGNTSRFIQDKVTEEHFKQNYKIIEPALKEEDISFANLRPRQFFCNNGLETPVCVLYTTKNIPAGSELGFPYDRSTLKSLGNYWRSLNTNRRLFNKAGSDITYQVNPKELFICLAKRPKEITVPITTTVFLDLLKGGVECGFNTLIFGEKTIFFEESPLATMEEKESGHKVKPAAKLLSLIEKEDNSGNLTIEGPHINLCNEEELTIIPPSCMNPCMMFIRSKDQLETDFINAAKQGQQDEMIRCLEQYGRPNFVERFQRKAPDLLSEFTPEIIGFLVDMKILDANIVQKDKETYQRMEAYCKSNKPTMSCP